MYKKAALNYDRVFATFRRRFYTVFIFVLQTGPYTDCHDSVVVGEGAATAAAAAALVVVVVVVALEVLVALAVVVVVVVVVVVSFLFLIYYS